jgi:hypothetical protein
VLLLSQNTSVGRRILGDVVPKDREYAANGIVITDLGTFAEWNKAFEGIFAMVDEAEGALEELRIITPSSSGRVRRPAAKSKESGTANKRAAPSEYIAAHAAGLEIYTVHPMLQQY